jgi:hypothetical protein
MSFLARTTKPTAKGTMMQCKLIVCDGCGREVQVPSMTSPAGWTYVEAVFPDETMARDLCFDCAPPLRKLLTPVHTFVPGTRK